jgi:hypothetical protein
MDPIGLDGTLALVIDVLREALANLNEDRRREEDRRKEEPNGPEDRRKEGPAGPTGKKSKKSKKSRDNRVAASEAEDEARKLNAHVSRLHRELSEQTAIATRERAMREKLDDRVASLVEEMRDMRAAHKHDLAELARALDQERERAELKRAELERAELKRAELERAELEGQEETKEKEKKEKKGRGKKGKERNTPSDKPSDESKESEEPKESKKSKESKESKDPSDDGGHGHSADGREGPEDRKEPEAQKEPEDRKAQKEPEGHEAQKGREAELVLSERIYDVSVRTTSAIAAMDPRELSRDDLCVMRTAMDVHCTTTVLDAHGMLCGLMHLTCPVTAMRAWAESTDSIDAMAVCLVRADPLGEKTRAAFTAAMLRRASGTELGRAVIDRGPGKHGQVRVVTDAARRCPLAAKPDEMLAWLVRARARSALDLGI